MEHFIFIDFQDITAFFLVLCNVPESHLYLVHLIARVSHECDPLLN